MHHKTLPFWSFTIQPLKHSAILPCNLSNLRQNLFQALPSIPKASTPSLSRNPGPGLGFGSGPGSVPGPIKGQRPPMPAPSYFAEPKLGPTCGAFYSVHIPRPAQLGPDQSSQDSPALSSQNKPSLGRSPLTRTSQAGW